MWLWKWHRPIGEGHGINDVMLAAFENTIVLGSVRWSSEMSDTVDGEKKMKGKIFSPIIRVETSDLSFKEVFY